MIDVPCKECKDRVLGCHCKCEHYKKYVHDREEIYKKAQDERILNAYTREASKRMKDRNRRNQSQFLKTQRS